MLTFAAKILEIFGGNAKPFNSWMFQTKYGLVGYSVFMVTSTLVGMGSL